jgi:signal transduction histidine kinase
MIGVHGATINNKAKGRRTGKIPEWRIEDFRNIVTRNADAMIVLDREGFVLFVNPAAESLFSLSSGEMVGSNFGFPIILDEPVEVYILREFKQFVAAEMRLVEVVWAGESSYLLSFRDLTDRIMAEQALSRARDELDAKVNKRTNELSETNQQLRREITERKRAEEAMKEAKQQAELYVDLMGHDINNLNHSAMGYLELALQTLEAEKRLKLDDKVFIERPMQALANSSALINNVMKLQMLMTEGVKTKPTDLNAIFRDLETMSFHSEGRDVIINIPHMPGLIVKANELLKDVFVNLITNATKHSDIEKMLTVNVKVEPVNENGQKYYRCSVEDNGPGIPGELKGQLFNRFKRGRTKAHGKGLGLYLVRTLVEGYGGKVWVEDRVPGDHTKGARFMVMLPASD